MWKTNVNGKTYQRNPYMVTFATNALYYKGIGSGIVRILAEYPEIRLENDVNGKEFKVAIPRTIPNGSLKYRNTTQKDSLKDSNTILKTDVATQKDSLKDSNTILKALEPIQAEVLKYIMAHPQATREEIFNLLPACCQECSLRTLNMPATKSRRRGTAELQVFVCDSSMALKLKMCVYIDKRWVRISYSKNFLLKDLVVSTK